MTFEDLLEKVKSGTCEETRALEKDYCEVVVSKLNLKSLFDVLVSHFGAPLKPADKAASEDAQHCAKSYGGVQDGQTLFRRQEGVLSEIALLWPWGNGASTTVKIARQLDA